MHRFQRLPASTREVAAATNSVGQHHSQALVQRKAAIRSLRPGVGHVPLAEACRSIAMPPLRRIRPTARAEEILVAGFGVIRALHEIRRPIGSEEATFPAIRFI